jgi:hypothetical protein
MSECWDEGSSDDSERQPLRKIGVEARMHVLDAADR